jgi:hypothetical protein
VPLFPILRWIFHAQTEHEIWHNWRRLHGIEQPDIAHRYKWQSIGGVPMVMDAITKEALLMFGKEIIHWLVILGNNVANVGFVARKNFAVSHGCGLLLAVRQGGGQKITAILLREIYKISWIFPHKKSRFSGG